MGAFDGRQFTATMMILLGLGTFVMKTRLLTLALATAVMLSPLSSALAHFIWVVNENGVIQVYFSETCEPGDAKFLEKVAAAKVWALSKNLRSEQPMTDVSIALADGQLTGKAPESVGIVGLSQDYGVVTRAEKSFLLRYFAKTYSGPLPGEWKELNNATKLALEITPKWNGKELQLKVTFNGRPAKDAEVNVDGCGISDGIVKTNDAGIGVCVPLESGLLSVRTKQEEMVEGMFEGKPYPSIRSYSTLSLPVNLPTINPIAHSLPELDKGITSFGAAISGDDLYVYGGHFGAAHHYSKDGQSNEFKRISLKAEKPTWEVLPEGPRLTGLALVAHSGKLYRVGGFAALNEEDAEQKLESQTSFAMYDPAAKSWQDLAPLPEGRSSHDAAVLDGKLYVIGGWKLGDPEPTVWHRTALVWDFTKENPAWEEISSPPFKRRALSLAAFGGKIYAIGGMQETGGPTTRVDGYDPAKKEWSVAPSILGSGMDGFGTSAFANGETLVVTTMSGSVQRLSADGKQWELIGQMQNPRFFHRQLATTDGAMLLVGGASMETGKINSFEQFTVGK
jgi:hypothetical protein